MNWIHLAEERAKWQPGLNMVMTFVFCEMQILSLTSRCYCSCKFQAVQMCCAGNAIQSA